MLNGETDNGLWDIHIAFETSLPLITFDDTYVADTTVMKGSAVTPKVLLKDPFVHLGSVKSPYSSRVMSIYYHKEKMVTFSIPSLDWCKNNVTNSSKLDFTVVGRLIGYRYYDNASPRDNNILTMFTFKGPHKERNGMIKYYENTPSIKPELTVNNISADGISNGQVNFRFKYDDLTLINQFAVNLIKLGTANQLGAEKIPLFVNAYNDVRYYNAIKYLGEIKSTDSVYVALIF